MAKMVEDARPVLRMQWRRQPNETGLARVIQAPRGWDLRATGSIAKLASVRPKTDMSRSVRGWYFYGGDDTRGVPTENTAAHGAKTPEDAMAQAERHFLTHLSKTFRVLIRRSKGMGKPATLEGTTHG